MKNFNPEWLKWRLRKIITDKQIIHNGRKRVGG